VVAFCSALFFSPAFLLLPLLFLKYRLGFGEFGRCGECGWVIILSCVCIIHRVSLGGLGVVSVKNRTFFCAAEDG